MKTLLLAILSLVLTSSLSAEGKEQPNGSEAKSASTISISGTVSDYLSGEHLAGVEVKIEGTDTKTYTDFDGNFSFQGMVPGEYKLVTRYISYETGTEELKTGESGNQVKIKLVNSK